MNHEKDKYHLYAKTNTANYIYHTRLKEHSNFQKKTNTNETLTKSHWRYFKTTYLFDWTIWLKIPLLPVVSVRSKILASEQQKSIPLPTILQSMHEHISYHGPSSRRYKQTGFLIIVQTQPCKKKKVKYVFFIPINMKVLGIRSSEHFHIYEDKKITSWTSKYALACDYIYLLGTRGVPEYLHFF